MTPAPTTMTLLGPRPTAPAWQVDSRLVRIVVARCQVDYAGRLTAHLPMATRVLMLKSDGSVLVHSDGGSYKPLNWMSPPCTVREGTTEDGQVEWTVAAKSGDSLRILIEDVLHDSDHDLGVDPGLQKDGVEKHLQELLAEHPATLGEGLSLVRREFPTAIGPVDLMCRDTEGRSVAVEIKRRGEIDGLEQLTRYLELLNRDPLLRPVRGIFAAQEIKPQARVLASDRGSPARRSTTTPCEGWTASRTGCSSGRGPTWRSRSRSRSDCSSCRLVDRVDLVGVLPAGDQTGVGVRRDVPEQLVLRVGPEEVVVLHPDVVTGGTPGQRDLLRTSSRTQAGRRGRPSCPPVRPH